MRRIWLQLPLYTNDYQPGFRNTLRHLTQMVSLVFPFIFTLRNSIPSWTCIPGCPIGTLYSTCLEVSLPCILYSQLLADSQLVVRRWHSANVSYQWQRLISLCGAITYVALTHPVSLGNKCVSPSLPRREGMWELTCEHSSPNNLSTGGPPPPTHSDLSVGPFRGVPPPCSPQALISWLPAHSPLDLLHRCQGSFQRQI